MSKYALPIIVGVLVAFVISGALSLLAATAGATAGASAGLSPAIVGSLAGVFTAYIMANLAGNRKGKAASSEQKDAAVALTPPPGQALLIVMREGFVGMAAGLNVAVDGQVVAQLKSPRFTALPLSVGSHEMELAFAAMAGKQNRPAVERFGAGAGEVIVYRAVVAMGLAQNTIALQRLSADADLSARLRGMTMTAPDA